MSKFFQAFLTGAFFTFFLDFFLFLGIKVNYIDFYEIDLYYNILFADNQHLYSYLGLTFLFGIIVIYIENTKLSIFVIGSLFLLSLSTLIQPIGHQVGLSLLSTKNVTFKSKRFSYHGDIYYDGRKEIAFYDYELKKIITLKKKDLL